MRSKLSRNALATKPCEPQALALGQWRAKNQVNAFSTPSA